MKERPILFNSEMVRAVLDGRKTQTRRAVPKWQMPEETEGPHDRFPDSRWMSVAQRDPRYGFGVFGATEDECMNNYNTEYGSLCPYGKPGDRLWVRETFRLFDASIECGCSDSPCNCPPSGTPLYRASHDDGESKWKPSIFMPRWASRVTLEIASVRVERLNDISEEDAKAEGVNGEDEAIAAGLEWFDKPRRAFRFLWQSINGAESWDANPWVWVVEFKRIDQQDMERAA